MGTTRGYQRRAQFGVLAGIGRGQVGPGGIAVEAGQLEDALEEVGGLDPAGPAGPGDPAAVDGDVGSGGALAVHSTLPSWTLLPLVPPSPFQGSLHTWTPAGPAEKTPPAATSCSSAARNSWIACSSGKTSSTARSRGRGHGPCAIGWPGDRVEWFAG